GRGAGGRRAHGAGGTGGGARLGVRRRDVSRGRGYARPQGGGRVGPGRDGGQGEGANRARVALHAQGSGRLHLFPFRRLRAAHPGGDQVRHHRDRVRNGAARLGGAASAYADERGGRATGGAGGGKVSREGGRRKREAEWGTAGA